MDNSPDVTIDGVPLSEGEKIVVWVALNAFRVQINDSEFARGVGEGLARNYDDRLVDVMTKWLAKQHERDRAGS